jgi:hypothetical protein
LNAEYRHEEWPASENVLKAKSPNLPNWTVNKIKNFKKIVEDRVGSQK